VVQALLRRPINPRVIQVNIEDGRVERWATAEKELETGFHNIREARLQRIPYLKDVIDEDLIG